MWFLLFFSVLLRLEIISNGTNRILDVQVGNRCLNLNSFWIWFWDFIFQESASSTMTNTHIWSNAPSLTKILRKSQACFFLQFTSVGWSCWSWRWITGLSARLWLAVEGWGTWEFSTVYLGKPGICQKLLLQVSHTWQGKDEAVHLQSVLPPWLKAVQSDQVALFKWNTCKQIHSSRCDTQVIEALVSKYANSSWYLFSKLFYFVQEHGPYFALVALDKVIWLFKEEMNSMNSKQPLSSDSELHLSFYNER